MEISKEKKLDLIKKHYKKEQNIIEVFLEEYEGFNIYIRIDYLKKINSFKLSWYDLDFLDYKIEKIQSIEFLTEMDVESLLNYFLELKENEYLLYDKKYLDSKVNIKMSYDNYNYNINFHKFLPLELEPLNIFVFELFQHLPKKLENLMLEIIANFTNDRKNYEYIGKIEFNLLEESLNNLFDEQIINKSIEIKNNVKFLEKINNIYYSYIDGVLVVLEYDNINKLIKYECSCNSTIPCVHLCNTIISIRNNKYSKFHKIIYKKNEDMMDTIKNFNYLLCTGVKDNYFEIINYNNKIELIPIYDNDKCNFKIIEENNKYKICDKI